MIRTILMLTFWGLAAPVAAVIGFSWTFITGDISVLYRVFTWGAFAGVWLTGVRVETVGLDKLDPACAYIYMTNHVSNLDPPIQMPLIPGSSCLWKEGSDGSLSSMPSEWWGVECMEDRPLIFLLRLTRRVSFLRFLPLPSSCSRRRLRTLWT